MTRRRLPLLLLVAVVAVVIPFACGGGDDGGGGGSSGPPVPTGEQADDAQLVEGREVYAANCARCHGSTGGGGVGPRLAGEVEDAFPDIEDQISLIRDGRGTMPSFGGSLSDDEIEAVARYEREVL